MWPFSRQSTLSKLVWLTAEQIRAERFSRALETVPGRREFTSEFVSHLTLRRNELEKIFWKVALFNTAILAVLFLNSSLIAADFSVAGISPKNVSTVKEMLLFVSSTLVVFTSYLSAQVQAINTLLTTWAKKNYPPNIVGFAKLKFVGLTISADLWTEIEKPHHYKAKATKIWEIILAIAVLVWALALITVSILISVVIVIDVIQRPSLPGLWSWGIVAYAVTAQVISLGMIGSRYVPLPYRDYTTVARLSELKSKDSKAFEVELRKEFEALWGRRK